MATQSTNILLISIFQLSSSSSSSVLASFSFFVARCGGAFFFSTALRGLLRFGTVLGISWMTSTAFAAFLYLLTRSPKTSCLVFSCCFPVFFIFHNSAFVATLVTVLSGHTILSGSIKIFVPCFINSSARTAAKISRHLICFQMGVFVFLQMS